MLVVSREREGAPTLGLGPVLGYCTREPKTSNKKEQASGMQAWKHILVACFHWAITCYAAAETGRFPPARVGNKTVQQCSDTCVRFQKENKVGNGMGACSILHDAVQWRVHTVCTSRVSQCGPAFSKSPFQHQTHVIVFLHLRGV